MAMVRWAGAKIEQVEKDCMHQPDRLQILRDTLMEIQTTVVRIQTEMESEQGDGDAAAAQQSPQHREWTRETVPPQSNTPGPLPQPAGVPQTINLEETVPNVTANAPGALLAPDIFDPGGRTHNLRPTPGGF